jgi:hypothetical protein
VSKFRKKPVVIDAIEYKRDDNIFAVQDFFKEFEASDSLTYNPDDNEYYITTLEGDMKLVWGDWVIRGVKGEFYPCKPDIFNMTYEPV